MNSELRITADGSHTLYLKNLDENYHSLHGAITESLHVFIHAGLQQFLNTKSKIHILEIGFGTGLNTLLSCLFAEENTLQIHYTTLEPSPLDITLIQTLNYSQQLSNNSSENIFNAIHAAPFEKEITITENFILLKQQITLETFQSSNHYDLVYFDAFGPRVQPEIWSLNNFQKLFQLIKPNGILVTYCAKGEVRRTMQAAGFTVERLPGPPGKREMLRALKTSPHD
ncbi:MAG: tRNA (5-methylaminomethyl-2-thiouridine)(34)-methyltransferase MnmD [Chitinophagales bacterium]|nr:tRNA (5-methylaminomethyl-2-thiouridine)(34)-methyltransferase MnmD [Chitinophagales bacterium]MBP8752795.1 tRNA (5-methylaminomethyl-2-thiouridine)(34)-methyltransferase MnmD [Chitinophagales bacterium]